MQDFILKELVTNNIESELEKIGFDIAYRAKASDKYRYKTFKLFNLTLPQANILKQTALSFGADCGVHREVLTSKVETTDAILGGSISQLKKICDKLKHQPFSMKILAEKIETQLKPQNRQTKIVGILNLTPDSFSDGGEYFSAKTAQKQLFQLIEDGADIIDIGAESTRPNSISIPPEEQIKRLNLISKYTKNLPIPLSIDTRSAVVAEFALDNGFSIINDVSGASYDTKIIDIAVEYNATIILQHATKNTEDKPLYKDVVEEVFLDLQKKYQLAQEKGLKNVILDAGIGFGKSKKENFEILDRIEEFYALNRPIMVGVSRKSLLGLEKSNDNNLKDTLSLAISYPLILKGIDYLRVHNVKLHKQLLNSVI